MIVSESEQQRQELDLTGKTLIKMNEALKGFEMRPLYIELWIMKWKKPKLNTVLQRLASEESQRHRHYLLQLHLTVIFVTVGLLF